jgi:hypothetical protein
MAEKKEIPALAPEQLAMVQEMLKTVIAEVRKPPELTEEQKAEKDQQVAMRRQQAELALARMEMKKSEQEFCSHMRRDNTSHAVLVNLGPVCGGEFLLCQGCQKIIRPNEDPQTFTRLLALNAPADF